MTSSADSSVQFGGATVCPEFGWQGSIAVALICAAVPQAVAGVERRAATSNGTRLYVDGAVAASFAAYSGGSVTNTAAS